MIKHADQLPSGVNEAMRGGPGRVKKTELATPEELQNKGRMYSVITLEPGCGIGTHDHQGETEIFYDLEGTADYNDNGTICKLPAGDVAICRPGESHGISNSGTETVRLVALILYK